MAKLSSIDKSYNSFYCFIVNNKTEALYFIETYNLKIKKTIIKNFLFSMMLKNK